uniref:MHC class I-like antigen recognition-like domain-containing protein n=1 Tax=Mola mola TaxID=94237 RepID=A0A3Q3WT72_MOLML
MLTNLCVLLPLLLSGRHSLTDIYTALSKPLRLPGIYEFIATGLLDGKMIDYFDSQTLRKALTHHWMSDGQREDYWDEDAQSRRICLTFCILPSRHFHTYTFHFLQWKHGCGATMEWTSLSFPTKRMWGSVQVLNENTEGYLEECTDWLRLLVDRQQESRASPPDVGVCAKNPRSGKVILTRTASGFSPKDIVLQVKRNGREARTFGRSKMTRTTSETTWGFQRVTRPDAPWWEFPWSDWPPVWSSASSSDSIKRSSCT